MITLTKYIEEIPIYPGKEVLVGRDASQWYGTS